MARGATRTANEFTRVDPETKEQAGVIPMKLRRYVTPVIVALLLLCTSIHASGEDQFQLPANLTVIEEEAFFGSSSLDTVVLPDRVQVIGEKAFANSSLKEIEIPNPSIEIAENAFDNTSGDLLFKGRRGSTAESYASSHGFRFVGMETTTVLTSDWDDFASLSSTLVQNYEGVYSMSGTGSAYASGRLIVKTEGALPDVSQFSPEVIVRDPENHYLIQFSDFQAAEDCAEMLDSAPGVLYVEPDQNLSGNDYYIDDFETQSYSWGVTATKADAYAADLRKRGVSTQIVVAVVDTGVDFSHPMLSGRLIGGYDFVDNDDVPQDGNRHGTHVSGTVVDCTPGLNVCIMPVRVLNNKGTGSISGVAQGIRYAARSHANVINMSLGGPHSNYVDEAVAYALQNGCVVVVAAGNDNDYTDSHCPAHITGCITVSAVNRNKQRASFSNYGSAVDIAAPGMDITSAVPGGGTASLNGTSMATPHVSAAAAMLLCDDPSLSYSAVESMLRDAATDLGSSGWDAYFGAGFLNLEPFVQSGPKQYTVSYNANSGTGAPDSQVKVEGIDLTLSSIRPTRGSYSQTLTVFLDPKGGTADTYSLPALKTTEYTFANWNTARDGSGTAYNPGASYKKDENATLFAQWTTSTSSETVSLPTPTREGYSFRGWSTDPYAESGVTGSYTPTWSVTLYAIWKANTYTVSYDANGGTGAPESQTKSYGSTLVLSSLIPTRSDESREPFTVTLNAGDGSVSSGSLSAERKEVYSFREWNSAADGTGTAYHAGASYSANTDTLLYAQWDSDLSVSAVVLPEATRPGYLFYGWGISSDDVSGVTGTYVPSGNVTLYALWRERYTVAYDANGGTGAPASQTKIQGTVLYLSSTKPTHAQSSAGSYTVTLDPNGGNVSNPSLIAERTISSSFQKWNTKADGSGKDYSAGEAYTADTSVTLYAQWNSTTMTKAVQLPAPSREGHSFKGWATSTGAASGITGSYTPSSDVTLYAIWEINRYTISYDANGGTDAPAGQIKTYGTALTLSAEQPKRASIDAGSYTVTLDANGGGVSNPSMRAAITTEYSFKSWNTAKNGSGTAYAPEASYTANAASTLYAQWNSSTVTATIMLPTPTRDGYRFIGWSTDRNGETGITGSYIPDANVTLYALWEVLVYTGECGENGSNVIWDLRFGTLTISGKGNMANYSSDNEPEWQLHQDSIRHVVIDYGVTGIGAYAFDGCSTVIDVSMPDSVSRIGAYAFRLCGNLTGIQLPAGLEQIEAGAFAGCSGLTGITIPKNVYAIGNESFRDCTGLQTVNIPKTVFVIENAAFQNCTALTDVYYDGTMTQWEDLTIGADNDSLMLAELHVRDIVGTGECGAQMSWTLYEEGLLAIEGVGAMTDYSADSPAPWVAFSSRITDASLSDGITTIGNYAFSACSNMTSVSIPEGVTGIGTYAFIGCTRLGSVALPESLTAIGPLAFRDCISLSEMSIPDGVVTLGYSAFLNCTGLKSAVLPNGIYTVPHHLFSGCTSLTTLTIPQSVGEFGQNAFRGAPLQDVYYLGSDADWHEIYNTGNVEEIYEAEIHFLKTVELSGECGSPSESLVWTLYDNGELAIKGTGRNGGGMANFSSSNLPPWYSERNKITSVSITPSFRRYTSDYSFYEAVVPITNIGDFAFADLTNLMEVWIPDGVTSVGESAFQNCSKLTDARIPAGVTAIGQSAFQNCTSLDHVTIPSSVTSIGANSFRGCSSLTSMTIPEGVTNIEQRCFQDCVNLTTVTIPSSVTSIGLSAFQSCSSLTEVLIPESVTSIAQGAFQACSGMTSVMIPGSLTSLGRYAFYNCSSLTDVYYGGTQEQWETVSSTVGNNLLQNAQIHYGTTIPTFYPINYNANGGSDAPAAMSKAHGEEILLSAEIPTHASESTGSHYTITLNANGGSVSPQSLTAATSNIYTFKEWNTSTDGSGAHYTPGEIYTGNQALTLYAQWESATEAEELALPTPRKSGYTFLGWGMSDSEASGITGSYIPSNDVTLYAIWVANSPELATGQWGNLTWKLEDGLLMISGEGVISNFSKNNNSSAWHSYLDHINRVIITNGITSIGDYAFADCSILTQVEIPDSVLNIGSFAFSNCIGLTQVAIPDGVTSIADSTFYGCSGLTQVEISESVTTIGNSAFYGCGLTQVDIPNSVISIGRAAFYGCKLTQVQIPEGVTRIEDLCFFQCRNLTSVIIPASVTSIGGSAFYRCSLTSLELSPNVTSIGSSAFTGCRFSSVEIPPQVTSIESSTFASCTELIQVEIPEGVTTIGDKAFYNCSELTSVTIPSSVTSIGNKVFLYCSKLTDVYYNGSEAQWNQITIGTENEALIGSESVTIHYGN